MEYLKKFVDYVFNFQNSEKAFDFDYCNCDRGMDCTLVWSQLMTLLWAEAELVGCAQTKCPGAINDHIVLCNFYPGLTNSSFLFVFFAEKPDSRYLQVTRRNMLGVF